MPLAKAVVDIVGVDNFRYVYAEEMDEERLRLGWGYQSLPDWCMKYDGDSTVLTEADVLYTGIRCLDLMEKRSKIGKITLYYSERWFKPIGYWSGRLRLLSPCYRIMAKHIVSLLNEDSNFFYLPIGPWAKKDMVSIGGNIRKMVEWGYFVDTSDTVSNKECVSTCADELSILWVGRMLKLKRVETIIKAVKLLSVDNRVENKRFALTLVGEGPDKKRLQRLAANMENVRFMSSVSISEVRNLMRLNDVYVFSSNGMDGWGGVVNEALEEGMEVFGTYETGASATLLPQSHLFRSGDYHSLAVLLSCARKPSRFRTSKVPYDYTARGAAERMLKLVKYNG